MKINFNVEDAIIKINELTPRIRDNVKSESHNIRDTVGGATEPYVPKWQPLLYKTYKNESSVFYEDNGDLHQTLSYDAWNPRTGFHYAYLRYYNNTSGVERWLEIGMRESQPLVEKILTNAVKRSMK